MYICIYVDSLLVALIMKVEFFITRCCKRNGSWIPKDFDTSHSHPKKKRPGLFTDGYLDFAIRFM